MHDPRCRDSSWLLLEWEWPLTEFGSACWTLLMSVSSASVLFHTAVLYCRLSDESSPMATQASEILI